MRSPFSAQLDALARVRGVTGAMIAGEGDGLVVDAVLHVGLRGDIVAALAASLFRRARQAAHAAGLGSMRFLQLEADNGRICAAGKGDLVVVAVAEPRANVGLIRMELMRAAEKLP